MLTIGTCKRILLFQVYPVWRSEEVDKRLPLGMLYLAGALKKAGFAVETFHIREDRLDASLAGIRFDDTLFAGICSIMTGYSLRCAITISDSIRKKNPHIPIIWGGVQPSAIPEICLSHAAVDGVGIGDGEELIVDIAHALLGEIPFESVPGFAFKNNDGETVVNPRRDALRDIDRFAPDYSLINLQEYVFNGNISGLLMTSRGCPYNCAFCYNNYYSQGQWRSHSVAFVQEQLTLLKERVNFSRFSVSDDNFFVNKQRAFSILEWAYEHNLLTYSLDIKINNLKDEEIKNIARYKVKSVFFGTESLNPRLISLINKKQTREQVFDTVARFARHAPDVQVQTEILMALPFESKKEMRQDIRDGLKLYRHNKNLSLYFGVLFPLPQTEMMAHAQANGFSPQSLQDYAGIDLNSAWSICHRWTSFKLTARECRKLWLTEAYAQILAIDRRTPAGFGKNRRIQYLWREIAFHLARFRLSTWIFTFYKFDYFLARCGMYGMGKVLKKMAVAIVWRLYNRSIKIPSRKIRSYNFGYVPVASRIRENVLGRLFGVPNLFKRLQAGSIIDALDIKPSDRILDFGCGRGFLTIETAKRARYAVGIDIDPAIERITIPAFLHNKLSFKCVRGEKTPFQDQFFDTVLASEVLPMIPDASLFLREIHRILKPGGKLVVVNGTGRPNIKKAFAQNSKRLQRLKAKYPDTFPASYEDYDAALQKSFGTGVPGFLSKERIMETLQANGFTVKRIRHSPSKLYGRYFEWIQFQNFLRKTNTVANKWFYPKFIFFSLIGFFDKGRYDAGFICTAEKT